MMNYIRIIILYCFYKIIFVEKKKLDTKQFRYILKPRKVVITLLFIILCPILIFIIGLFNCLKYFIEIINNEINYTDSVSNSTNKFHIYKKEARI